MAVVHPAGRSGDAMSERGRISQVGGASPAGLQSNPPIAGGAIVVLVEVLVPIEVDVLLGVVVSVVVRRRRVRRRGGRPVWSSSCSRATSSPDAVEPAGESVASEPESVLETHPAAASARTIDSSITSRVS